MMVLNTILLAMVETSATLPSQQVIDSSAIWAMIASGLVIFGTVSADWVKTKSSLPKSFSEIAVAEPMVDLQESSWPLWLWLSEPYRLESVLRFQLATGDVLMEHSREHGRSYTNKMLVVMAKLHDERSLICMGCIDDRITVVVHIKVDV